MLVAYKGFEPGLECLGYRFMMGKWNEEEKAECHQEGFHSAYEPFDCLNYYGWDEKNIFCMVIVDGIIHEEEYDTKIASTRIMPYRQLSLEEFVYAEIIHLINHPYLGSNRRVINGEEYTTKDDDKFVVIRGKNPKVTIKRKDVIVGILKEADDNKSIIEVNFFTTGKNYPLGTYNAAGKINTMKRKGEHK